MNPTNLNPFEAPRKTEPDPLSDTREYYWVKISKLSYREIWYATNNALEYFFAAAFKTFRIPNPTNCGISITSEIIPNENIPLRVVEKMQLWATQAEQHQLPFEFCYAQRCIGPQERYVSIFPSRDFLLDLTYEGIWADGTHRQKLVVVLISRLTNGGRIITAGQPVVFSDMPNCKVEVEASHSLAVILNRHRSRISGSPVGLLPFRDLDDVYQFTIASENEAFQYLIERKVLVKIPENHLIALKKWSAKHQTPPTKTRLAVQSLIGGVIGIGGVGALFWWFDPPQTVPQTIFRIGLFVLAAVVTTLVYAIKIINAPSSEQ